MVQLPHTGSWGLPDFGITEAIGSAFNKQPSYQGGSNLMGPQPQPRTQVLGATTTSPSGGQQYSSPIGPVNQAPTNNYTAPSPSNNNPNVNPGTNFFWDAADGWKQISQNGTGQEIDNAYRGTMEVLGQAENNLRGQLPGLISEAEAQARASQALLEGQRTGAVEQLGSQEQQTNQLAQNQTAQQRQILQELSQANQARFGGSSSAGQAASELQGREFQRSRAGIQQQAQQGLQTIAQERTRVEREYQQGLQQLEVNKQQAVNQINRTFQDRLLEINSRRAETESAKAQARLQALQEYRNQAFQINTARMQFEQQLQLQSQQNLQQLSQVEQTYLSSMNQGQGAVNNQSGYQASAIPGVNQGQQNTTTNPYVGQIAGQRKDERLN